MINFEIIKKELANAKSLHDLLEDINFYNENMEILKRGIFDEINDRLTKSVYKYGQAINDLSIFTNIKVVEYKELNYNIVYNSLFYITQNIPIYAGYMYLKDRFVEIVLKTIENNIM